VTKSFEVIASVFSAPGCDGDFSWMSRQAEHEKNSFGHLSKVNDLGLPLVAEMLGFAHFEA